MRPEAGHARVGDEVDGVSGPCVFSHGAVREVHLPRVFGEDDVLQHRPKAHGMVDLGLQLGVEVDALGVTSPLDVEDAVLGPAVLVVPNEGPVRVRGQSGFACNGRKIRTQKQKLKARACELNPHPAAQTLRDKARYETSEWMCSRLQGVISGNQEVINGQKFQQSLQWCILQGYTPSGAYLH